MALSPRDKQRYELEVINDKFSECLERSKQFAECGEPYRYDYTALTRQNDDLQRLLHVHDGQLAKIRCELAKKEAECANEQLKLEKSQKQMQELEKRITDSRAQRDEASRALDDAEEELSKNKAANTILKERNKKLERELELEQEHLQRQHDHWEVQLKEEQLQKAAIEETVMIRTGHLESSVPGLEAGHESLDHSLNGYMAMEEALMTKSATLESDKIKGKLDYWRGELKELEATTKIKTRENFEEIKKGCEEKVKQTESRTRLEVDRLQDANTEILDKLSRLAPQVKEIREETDAQSKMVIQLEDLIEEQTKDVEDIGVAFELCYYKVLLEELASQREQSLHQTTAEEDKTTSSSQPFAAVGGGYESGIQSTSGHAQIQNDEGNAKWNLNSAPSFDRNLTEVKALVDATEAASARMLQNASSTMTSEC